MLGRGDSVKRCQVPNNFSIHSAPQRRQANNFSTCNLKYTAQTFKSKSSIKQNHQKKRYGLVKEYNVHNPHGAPKKTQAIRTMEEIYLATQRKLRLRMTSVGNANSPSENAGLFHLFPIPKLLKVHLDLKKVRKTVRKTLRKTLFQIVPFITAVFFSFRTKNQETLTSFSRRSSNFPPFWP